MTFGLFTHMAQKAQWNIFTYVSLPTGLEDHHRVLDHPVLLNFPSAGTYFATVSAYGRKSSRQRR